MAPMMAYVYLLAHVELAATRLPPRRLSRNCVATIGREGLAVFANIAKVAVGDDTALRVDAAADADVDIDADATAGVVVLVVVVAAAVGQKCRVMLSTEASVGWSAYTYVSQRSLEADGTDDTCSEPLQTANQGRSRRRVYPNPWVSVRPYQALSISERPDFRVPDTPCHRRLDPRQGSHLEAVLRLEEHPYNAWRNFHLCQPVPMQRLLHL